MITSLLWGNPLITATSFSTSSHLWWKNKPIMLGHGPDVLPLTCKVSSVLSDWCDCDWGAVKLLITWCWGHMWVCYPTQPSCTANCVFLIFSSHMIVHILPLDLLWCVLKNINLNFVFWLTVRGKDHPIYLFLLSYSSLSFLFLDPGAFPGHKTNFTVEEIFLLISFVQNMIFISHLIVVDRDLCSSYPTCWQCLEVARYLPWSYSSYE